VTTVRGLKLAAATVLLIAVVGIMGCSGPRFDTNRYLAGQAFYQVNPKCLDEFRPCQSP
jgi:hypothetical protein